MPSSLNAPDQTLDRWPSRRSLLALPANVGIMASASAASRADAVDAGRDVEYEVPVQEITGRGEASAVRPTGGLRVARIWRELGAWPHGTTVGIDAGERSWLGPDSVRTQARSSRGCRPRRELSERRVSLRSFHRSGWVWGSVFTRLLVPPTCQHTNPHAVIEGPELAVGAAHSKIRRDGYRRTVDSVAYLDRP